MKIDSMNCEERIKENMIIAVMQQLKQLQLEPGKKIQALMGCEPTTFAIPVQTCPN